MIEKQCSKTAAIRLFSYECRVFLKEIDEEIVKIGKRVFYLGLIRNFTFAIYLK